MALTEPTKRASIMRPDDAIETDIDFWIEEKNREPELFEEEN